MRRLMTWLGISAFGSEAGMASEGWLGSKAGADFLCEATPDGSAGESGKTERVDGGLGGLPVAAEAKTVELRSIPHSIAMRLRKDVAPGCGCQMGNDNAKYAGSSFEGWAAEGRRSRLMKHAGPRPYF